MNNVRAPMGKRDNLNWRLQHQALKRVHAAMASMLHEGLHADIKIESQRDVTLAHGSVLASMSPVFKEMLGKQKMTAGCEEQEHARMLRTLKLEEISTTKALRAFLRILYVGEFDPDTITWEQALEILAASHHYQLPAVKAICASALANMLTHSNSLRILEYAHMYDEVLFRKCKKYVAKHFKQVVLTDGFEDLAVRKPTILVDLVRDKTHCSVCSKMLLGLRKLISSARQLSWYGMML